MKLWYKFSSVYKAEVSREIQQWVSTHSGRFVWGCISTSRVGDCVNMMELWQVPSDFELPCNTIWRPSNVCTFLYCSWSLCFIVCMYFFPHCSIVCVRQSRDFCVKCAAEIQIKVSLSIRCCVATFRFWIVATATNCLYTCWFCCR